MNLAAAGVGVTGSVGAALLSLRRFVGVVVWSYLYCEAS